MRRSATRVLKCRYAWPHCGGGSGAGARQRGRSVSPPRRQRAPAACVSARLSVQTGSGGSARRPGQGVHAARAAAVAGAGHLLARQLRARGERARRPCLMGGAPRKRLDLEGPRRATHLIRRQLAHERPVRAGREHERVAAWSPRARPAPDEAHASQQQIGQQLQRTEGGTRAASGPMGAQGRQPGCRGALLGQAPARGRRLLGLMNPVRVGYDTYAGRGARTGALVVAAAIQPGAHGREGRRAASRQAQIEWLGGNTQERALSRRRDRGARTAG